MAKFTKIEKSWMLYDWANSAYSMTVTSTILPIYFKAVFEKAGGDPSISTAYWGYANSFATLILAILAPILGSIADYYGFKKKFFLFFFSLGIIFTSLLAIVPDTYWVTLLIVYMVTLIGFSGANIFYDAFLVDVTEDERMDKVSSMGFAMGYIGSTLPFMLSMAIVILAQYEKIPLSMTNASRVTFIITAVWWTLFTIPMLKNVHQVYGVPPEDHPVKNSFKRLSNTFKDIKAHRGAFLFLLAYFFYIDGVDTIIKMATSYGTDLGISATNLLIILLVTQFVAFPFAILYGWLAERFGGKTMLYVGIGVYTVICIFAFFIKTTLDFWILAMMVGTSQGGIQAISRSYFGKLIPKNKANEFFGFYNIFGKFAAIMGPLLIAIVTQMTGKSNYGVVSVIILFILGGFFLTRVPNLSEPISTTEK